CSLPRHADDLLRRLQRACYEGWVWDFQPPLNRRSATLKKPVTLSSDDGRSSSRRPLARFFAARVQSIAPSGLDRDCRAHRRLGVDSVSAHRSAAALLYVQDGQNPPVSYYWLHGAAHVLALQLSHARCDLCGLFGCAG